MLKRCFFLSLKNARESKNPAYCTDLSLGGPFFSNYPEYSHFETLLNKIIFFFSLSTTSMTF